MPSAPDRRRRLGRPRVRGQSRQRRVPSFARRVAVAASGSHRARSKRCGSRAMPARRSTSPRTSSASARSRGSSRSARCAPRSFRSWQRRGRRRPCAARALDSLTWTADGCELRCAGDIDVARAPRRRRRRSSLACARTRRHRRRRRSNTDKPRVVANFNCERRASRPRVPVVPRRWRRSRVAAAAGTPRSRWSGRRPEALARELLACRPKRSPTRVAARGDHALGAFEPIDGAPGFRCSCRSCRPRSSHRRGADRRRRARHPSARRPGRQSRFRRCRGAGGCAAATAGPVDRSRASRCCSSASRAGAGRPVLAMQSVTDGLARPVSPRRRRSCGRRATWAWRAVDRLPPPNDFSRIPRYASDIHRSAAIRHHRSISSISSQPAGDARLVSGALLRAFPCPRRAAKPAAAGTAHCARRRRSRSSLEQKFQGAVIGSVTKSAYFGSLRGACSTTSSSTPTPRSRTSSSAIVYDTATKQEPDRTRAMRELSRVSFDSLPLELAIKKVKGNGAAQARGLLRRRLPVLRAARERAQEHRQRDDLHVPVSRSTSCIRTPRASRG